VVAQHFMVGMYGRARKYKSIRGKDWGFMIPFKSTFSMIRRFSITLPVKVSTTCS
jgi:hypothetical protein